MATTLTLRTVKGSPLTNLEVDTNFTSIKDEKIERDGTISMTGKLTLVSPTTARANMRVSEGAADPISPAIGDIWNHTGTLKFRKDGSNTYNIITSETGQTFAGDVTIGGTLTVNGSTTTINSTTVSVDDKNIVLADTASPSDTTSDGGGITLQGTTPKTLNWVQSTSSWTSSENVDIATGKTFKVNGVNVLSSTALGSSVVSSSLTSVGTLTNLTVTNPITGAVSGNAGTATILATTRTINGVSFNGSADITVTAAAGTVTGTTLASNVVTSSLTTVGTLGSLTMGGTVNTADNVISRPRFTDYAETYTTPAISAGTLTLNIENGNVFRVSRNANITTLTISNPSATGNACSFTLIFDANGTSYTIAWPAAVKWPTGVSPTITTTAGRSDMFVFYTNTAGATWYAMTASQNFVT